VEEDAEDAGGLARVCADDGCKLALDHTIDLWARVAVEVGGQAGRVTIIDRGSPVGWACVSVCVWRPELSACSNGGRIEPDQQHAHEQW
jgi:hypothetical protein